MHSSLQGNVSNGLASAGFAINGDVDQGTLAAQVVLHMYIRARADQSFLLLLSELQVYTGAGPHEPLHLHGHAEDEV